MINNFSYNLYNNNISFCATKKDNLPLSKKSDIVLPQVVKGKYASANVFKYEISDEMANHIKQYCSCPVFKNSTIAIMPDGEAYNGNITGISAKVEPSELNNLSPDVIGNDIGCGVLVIKTNAKEKEIDYEGLDRYIKFELSNSSASVNHLPNELKEELYRVAKALNIENPEEIEESLATLGGGNHFIELDKDDDGNIYLAIHTGSRKLGFLTAEFYRKSFNSDEKDTASSELKYIDAVRFVQKFAEYNRMFIAKNILTKMGVEPIEVLDCPHNYISDDMILHKGTIDASLGKKLAIPLNMRDGIVLGVGKGNPKWNCSAPHGSGRKYSRSEAKRAIDYKAYCEAMKGIYTTSVSKKSIDEAPQAYNDSKEILDLITQTIKMDKVISPVYVYKKKS